MDVQPPNACAIASSPSRRATVSRAGVLSLDVPELIKLVSATRATDAESIGERARALAVFGRFFLGQLWDRCAGHARTET